MLRLLSLLGLLGLGSGVIVNCTLKASLDGGYQLGELSHGYFSAPVGTSFRQPACGSNPATYARVILGDMSSFLMEPGASMLMKTGARFESGSYSLVQLDTKCSVEMEEFAGVVGSTAGIGRSEIYCNESLTLGAESYIKMAPQSLFYNKAKVSIGDKIIIKMDRGAALNVSNSLSIEKNAIIAMSPQSRIDILPSAGGIVTITSSKAKPIVPTTVVLEDSAKIIVEGTMAIGKGQHTKVQLLKSGLLMIGTAGKFSIASSTFDIGRSSFWIINGTFAFDDGSTLKSGLQSNISVTETGIFKTLKDGNVTVGAGGSLLLQGQSIVSGLLQLDSSAHLTISPISITTIGADTRFSMGYAATAFVEGYMTLSSGSPGQVNTFLDLDPSAIFHVGPQVSLTVPAGKGIHLEQRGTFSLDIRKGSRTTCFLAKNIVVSPCSSKFENITTANQANALGFICI